MVAHPASRLNLVAAFLTSLAAGLEQQSAAIVIDENVFARITAVHYVVNRTGILQSQFADHALAAIGYCGVGPSIIAST